MLIKTEGFVFKTIKYSETSRIVKIYTRDKGLQSYMIKGVKSKKSKFSPALLNNLNILEIDAYDNPKKEIQLLKEAKLAYQYKSIPFNINKSTVILFLNEVLYKSIKEEEKNEELYNFIKTALLYYDEVENDFNDFHIFFLAQLTKHLGFFPKLPNTQEARYFNLREGKFSSSNYDEKNTLNQELSEMLVDLCTKKINHFLENPLKRNLRNSILPSIIQYYSFHIHNFKEIKSLEVLKSIYS